MTVDTGARLGGRYRLDERIATGGMGEVWRARDELLDRDVAVKALKREYAEDDAFLDRFRAEARHTAGLAHPGIASVFDYGENDGTAYLVMELVPGEPLSAILAREGRLSPDRALDVVAQAGRALDVAHQSGVIHRDVKPGNILVCPDGTVKLTDFGIARAADATPLTRTGVVLGTAQYLSPEQANGAAVTPASDVYSLGVVAYECLAGRRPFDGDTPVGIAMAHLNDEPLPLPGDVPPDAAGLVTRALAKDPADRFATAADVAAAADAARSERPAMPPTMALPVVDGPHRPSRRTAIAAVATAFLAALLLTVAWNATRPPPKRTVPPIVGKTKTAAYAALDRLGLEHTERTQYSRRYRAGVVTAADPAAGAVLRKGDNVAVTISRGPQPVSLPGGLFDQPVDDAVATLSNLGLTVTRLGVESDQDFGTVLAVTPADGLHQGDTVTVTYSTGRFRKHGKGNQGD